MPMLEQETLGRLDGITKQMDELRYDLMQANPLDLDTVTALVLLSENVAELAAILKNSAIAGHQRAGGS